MLQRKIIIWKKILQKQAVLNDEKGKKNVVCKKGKMKKPGIKRNGGKIRISKKARKDPAKERNI